MKNVGVADRIASADLACALAVSAGAHDETGIVEVGKLKRDGFRASQPAPVDGRSPAATLALPSLQCATMLRLEPAKALPG